jgi:hypothetical protein
MICFNLPSGPELVRNGRQRTNLHEYCTRTINGENLAEKQWFSMKMARCCQLFLDFIMPILQSWIINYAPVFFQSIFAPEIVLYDDQQKKYPG